MLIPRLGSEKEFFPIMFFQTNKPQGKSASKQNFTYILHMHIS